MGRREDALRGHARASPATGHETDRPPAGRFCFALFTPSPCPAGVASTTTRQPCSRATIWAKQNQNRLKTQRDIRMRDISRGEGNLKREALWGGGDSLVIHTPTQDPSTDPRQYIQRVLEFLMIIRLPRILELLSAASTCFCFAGLTLRTCAPRRVAGRRGRLRHPRRRQRQRQQDGSALHRARGARPRAGGAAPGEGRGARPQEALGEDAPHAGVLRRPAAAAAA